MAKATKERTDPSQLWVHHKGGKSKSGEAAAHSTATAGIREQWTHLAAQLPFFHVYGPGSQTENGATHSWHSHLIDAIKMTLTPVYPGLISQVFCQAED